MKKLLTIFLLILGIGFLYEYTDLHAISAKKMIGYIEKNEPFFPIEVKQYLDDEAETTEYWNDQDKGISLKKKYKLIRKWMKFKKRVEKQQGKYTTEINNEGDWGTKTFKEKWKDIKKWKRARKKAIRMAKRKGVKVKTEQDVQRVLAAQQAGKVTAPATGKTYTIRYLLKDIVQKASKNASFAPYDSLYAKGKRKLNIGASWFDPILDQTVTLKADANLFTILKGKARVRNWPITDANKDKVLRVWAYFTYKAQDGRDYYFYLNDPKASTKQVIRLMNELYN